MEFLSEINSKLSFDQAESAEQSHDTYCKEQPLLLTKANENTSYSHDNPNTREDCSNARENSTNTPEYRTNIPDKKKSNSKMKLSLHKLWKKICRTSNQFFR